MTTDKRKNIPEIIAKVISVIFHPLLMPVYGILIIFSSQTLFGYLPFNVKKLLFLIIFINNVLLPFSLLPFFRYRNIITSWSIDNRRERIIPLLTITILYAATSYIIFRFPIPALIKSFVFASFFISLLVTAINFWWKISVHSVGAGALTALVFVLSVKMYTPLFWYLILVIILAGLVLSSRLRLNAHSPGQVWIGLLTGFLGLSLYIWFF
jgi:membrane-associated phospholipid phosphatase